MNRRHALRFLASAAVLAGSARLTFAGETRIAALIGQAWQFPAVRDRVAFISRMLVGSRYRGYTLIGGPRRPEQFVTRDDVFDCVTYCETVLAAARARTIDEFEPALRQIRYRDGRVAWHERNHYFADWCARNIANGVCRAVAIPGNEVLDKRVSYMPTLGAHRVSMAVTPRAGLLANKELLASGDIIGFLSQRPRLDYFHIGFVIVDDGGALWLRHAAKSRGRVIDEPLGAFLSLNGVQAVTLLRPLEPKQDSAIV